MDSFSQFIQDMIHMTEGEKLVYYWPLWLVITVVGAVVSILLNKKKR